MRIATFNVQWFDHLFDAEGHLREDGGPSGREGVDAARRGEALGRAFQALDADAVLVVEAPDARGHGSDGEHPLQRFARRFGLRTTAVVTGVPSGTRQEVALLHDPAALFARHDPQGGAVPRFDGTFRVDLDHDGRPEPVAWSKPPLEVAVRTGSGAALRLIGVHAKSKAAYGARDPAQATRIAIENRRKQFAQCVWLRARVDRHLAAGDALAVLGDFNDGPGLDEFEALFGRSGVEIVLGEGDAVPLLDPHARPSRGMAEPTTARFRVPSDDPSGWRWLPALLDYVMVSPDLAGHGPRWRIWHPLDDPAIRAAPCLAAALLDASDHFPVSLDLDL